MCAHFPKRYFLFAHWTPIDKPTGRQWRHLSLVETAQMRDLVLNGRFGRGTTIATFLLHRIRPPVQPGPRLQVKLCHP
jgi:hypothetical protein